MVVDVGVGVGVGVEERVGEGDIKLNRDLLVEVVGREDVMGGEVVVVGVVLNKDMILLVLDLGVVGELVFGEVMLFVLVLKMLVSKFWVDGFVVVMGRLVVFGVELLLIRLIIIFLLVLVDLIGFCLLIVFMIVVLIFGGGIFFKIFILIFFMVNKLLNLIVCCWILSFKFEENEVSMIIMWFCKVFWLGVESLLMWIESLVKVVIINCWIRLLV